MKNVSLQPGVCLSQYKADYWIHMWKVTDVYYNNKWANEENIY